MFCVACREERLGPAYWCVECGAKLQVRARELIEAEREHVRFLLAEIDRWDTARASKDLRKYLEQKYQQRERVLVAVLAGREIAPQRAAAAPEPGLAPEPIAQAAPSTEPERAPDSTARAVPPPASESGYAPAPEPDVDSDSEPEREPAMPVPELPLAAAFEAPLPVTPEQQIIEQASTWSRLWKPFLYESIGWFVGGFLILAGTLFFVAESWEGMTTTLRSLVVFGLTAGYSAGFSIWGRFFLKREKVVGAGRVLGLIGSAAAPLPALALLPLAGASPLFWGALIGWCAAAAWLSRAPTDAYEPALQPVLQLAMALTAASMALAPFLVRLGPLAIWLDAAAVIWLAVALELRADRRGAFALLAPAYLGLLFAIRLHVALTAAGVAVPVAAYAPLVAALGFVAVRARRALEGRAVDPVAVGVVALQVAAIAASVVRLDGVAAPPSAFFLSSALCTVTLWQLGRGEGARARWHYATYAVGYLAYQSVGTIVPGPVMELFLRVKAWLGYATQRFVPPNFAAVYAVPYVIAVGAFAARLFRSDHVDPVERERRRTVGGVLLNATAAGAAFFCAEAMAGTDLRPGLWAVPPLAIACLALGLWLERRLLSWVGSLSLLTLPVSMGVVYSAEAGAVTAGALALALAVLSWRVPRDASHGRSVAAAALAIGAGVVSLVPPHTLFSATAAAMGAVAMAVLAIKHKHVAWAGCAALSMVTVAVAALAVAGPFAPVATALAAAALAAASRRKSLETWGAVAVTGAIVAVVWAVTAGSSGWTGPVPVLAAGWVACLLASPATSGWAPVIGAPMLAAAIAPEWLDLGALWAVPPPVTMALLGAMALGASVWTVIQSRPGALGGAGVPISEVITTASKRRVSAASTGGTSGEETGAPRAETTSPPFPSRGGRSPAAIAHGLVATLAAAGFGVFRIDWFHAVASHWPLFAAAGVALLAARATWPRISLAWAALLAAAASVDHLDYAFAGALAFTALAALDEWPRARALLFGPRPVATIAASGAVLAALVGRLMLISAQPFERGLAVVAIALLALAWARTSGRALFLAVPALLVAPWAVPPELVPWSLMVLPLFSVAVVRVASWSPRALNRLVPGGSPDQVSLWALGALFVSTGAAMVGDPEHARWLAIASAGALVLSGGSFQWLRVAGAAALLLPYPEARLAGIAALLGLGFFARHAPSPASHLSGPQERARTPLACALAAVALALVHWQVGAFHDQTQLFPGLLLVGGTLFAAALLSGLTWGLGLAAFATSVGLTRFGLPLTTALSVGAAAWTGLAALLRRERAQAAAHAFAERAGAGLPGPWSLWLWCAGAASALLASGTMLSGQADLPSAVLLLIGAALLLWTQDRMESAIGAALFGLAAFAVLPGPWRAVGGASAGLALCLASRLFAGRLTQARVLRHAGWVVSLVSLVGLHSLEHASTPIAGALAMLSVWAAVWGNETFEPLGWAASLAWLHSGLFSAGLMLATGKPQSFILPYIGAASALLGAAALWLGPKSGRRVVGLVAAAIAFLELGGGLSAIETQALREALVAGVALASLAVVAVVAARRDRDEPAAFVAQIALAVGYLVVRRHGMGSPFGQGDALVALLAGAAFGGLYGWAARQESSVFRRPAMFGAIALPVIGLLAAPWEREPLVGAALLVGMAAHFAAMARLPDVRRPLSLLSAAAFNVALLVAWQATGSEEPQYYVIPAAVSVLVLLRIFRDQLSDVARARLRALALTALYGAAAWKPLVFDETWAMLICALVCVLGVAAGVATRIRSYVYLGTGFLVVTVSANLVRYGMRDHRLGAVFLSVLGLLVVGFMVLLSAQRAELLKRYERVRQLLGGWE